MVDGKERKKEKKQKINRDDEFLNTGLTVCTCEGFFLSLSPLMDVRLVRNLNRAQPDMRVFYVVKTTLSIILC